MASPYLFRAVTARGTPMSGLPMKARATDPQRERVYRWQAIIWPKHFQPPEAVTLPARLPERLNDLFVKAWAYGAPRFGLDPALLPLMRINVRLGNVWGGGRNRRRGYAGIVSIGRGPTARFGPGIVLGYDGIVETVLLHELAHLLTWGHGHDAHFCRAALDLYVKFLSVDEQEALRVADEIGVAIEQPCEARR